MKMHPIQESFAAGEVTPRVQARLSTELYSQGLEELLNMIPLRHGPVQRRGGMQYNSTYPGDVSGRLFTFHISPAQSFVVVISDDGILRVNDETGQVLEDNLITNPFFDDGLTGWTDISDANAGVQFSNGTVGFGSTQVGRDAILHQSVTIAGGEENDDHQISIVSVPSSRLARLTIKVGTAANLSDIDEFTLIEGVNSLTFNPGGNSTVFITIVFEGVAPLITFWTVDSVRCSHIGAGGVQFAHPWGADDISEMQAEMPPNEDVMFFATPRVAQQELTYDRATDVFGFAPISFTVPPPVWTGANFPTTITFFQGRSWWGGTPEQPATFWGSKSGIIRDMTQGQVADDSVEFTLSRRGRIEWMEGVKNLLVGTENGEFIITSQEGIIEPGDISVEQQSAYGSTNAEARPIGNQVLYLAADGTKLRELDYSWTESGWLSRDLSFPAEHMPTDSAMREVHYVKDPESLIANLSARGEIYVCTYDPNSKFVGWSRVTTAGRIISLTVTQQRGSSELWVLVDRGLNDPTQFFLERFVVENVPRDYLDSFATQFNEPASTAITGITHLKNQTVSVSVDGATHPDITLDANGDGTLDFAGVRIAVGLKYNSLMRTLPMVASTKTGSGYSMAKRWNRLFLRVLDSALPLVNGQRQPDRTPATLMDVTEPDRDRDIETRLLGWDQFAQIEVSQDLPRGLTVLALYGEYNQEGV